MLLCYFYIFGYWDNHKMIKLTKQIRLFIWLSCLIIFTIRSNNSGANSILIDKNNKIVVGGFFADLAKVSAGLDFLLVRYNDIGILDRTFNSRGPQPGILATSITRYNNEINGIKLDSKNKIVAAGYASDGINRSIALARYNDDGSLDSRSFNPRGTNSGIPGIVTSKMAISSSVANALAIDKKNKIVVAGSSALSTINSLSSINILVAKYHPDGLLDRGFGANGPLKGVVNINISALQPQLNISGATNIANAVTVDNNNKIILAGYADNGLSVGIIVVRLNEDGSLDRTFNQFRHQPGFPGVVITNVGDNSRAVGVVVDKNNRILVSGASLDFKTNISSLVLVRYNSDGSFDKTFNSRSPIPGIVVKNFSGEKNNEIPAAIVIDSDNKIVVTGFSQVVLPSQFSSFPKDIYGSINFLTARFNYNGTVDKAFNAFLTPGFVVTQINYPSQSTFTVPTATVPTAKSNSIAIDKFKRIVVSGFSSNGSGLNVTTVRYLSNGQLDRSFAGSGIVITSVTNGQFPELAER